MDKKNIIPKSNTFQNKSVLVFVHNETISLSFHKEKNKNYKNNFLKIRNLNLKDELTIRNHTPIHQKQYNSFLPRIKCRSQSNKDESIDEDIVNQDSIDYDIITSNIKDINP